MKKFHTKGLAVTVLLAVLAFTLSGCWNPFDPDGGKPVPVPPADYHDRLTVEDVLHNLKTAYEYMEPDPYLDCLSEDFAFYPNEFDVQNPDLEIPPVWWKPDEQGMHENMFDDGSNVESISLTLTIITLEINEGIPEDPEDDLARCEVDVDLRVNLLGNLTLLATADSQYDMRIDVDQVGPEGEYLWEIYEWYDLDPAGRGREKDNDPRVELVSFSELKSQYLH